MVPGRTTDSGVMPSNIHGARIAQYGEGAQVFAVDDGPEADAVAHGSLPGKLLQLLLPWGLVPPGMERLQVGNEMCEGLASPLHDAIMPRFQY